MTTIFAFGGSLSILLLIVFTMSRKRLRRLTCLANEQAFVSALGFELSSADHFWLTRSLLPEPSVMTLAASGIILPDDLHDALGRSMAQVSMVKRGPTQRAREAAEIRARREDLISLVPQIERAASASFPMLDAVLMEAIQAAPNVADTLISAAVNLEVPGAPLPGLDGLHDAAADGVSSVGEHAVHVIADAHIPIVTIVTSVNRYCRAAENGLDTGTAISEGAYDIALRGGGVAAGATIGAHALGTFMPVVGHLVGAGLGALGGWIGAQINAQRQEQPLREADAALQARLRTVGDALPAFAWSTLTDESWSVVRHTERALVSLSAELDASLTFWRRHIWPTFLDVVCVQAISRGHADIAAEAEQARTLDRIVMRMRRDPSGQACLAAVALARPSIRSELGLDDAAVRPLTSSLKAVRAERDKLELIRAA